MSSSGKMKELLFICLVVAGLSSAALLSGYVERSRPPEPESWADEDLSLQGSRLKGFSLGMDGLLADWYWMRALQYVGNKVINSRVEYLDLEDLRPLNPRLLEPYLRTSTDLDPHFMAPYSFGAIVLPSVDKQKALELTKKGIENNPDEWRLYQHLGFIYWKLGRYEEASAAYADGAKKPGAPGFLDLMSAAMKTKGGSRETAVQIYRQMYEQGEDVNIRNAALMRWQHLIALDEMEAVNALLSDLRDKRGRCPSDLREIVPHLQNFNLPGGRSFHLNQRGELVDPRGDAYRLDPSCQIQLNPASPLPRN